MSDITIDLSGIIALVVFFGSAAAFFVAGIISVLVANSRGRAKAGGVKKHSAYGFFATAAVLMVLNLAGFGVMWYLFAANVSGILALADDVALFGWIPLEIVIWVFASSIYNRFRR